MRRYSKALLVVFICLLTGAALWHYGRQAYRSYSERRAVQQAFRFATRQDWANAALSARKALRLNPASLQACEIMARITETLGAPQAIEWRQRIAILAPTVTNKLALAATALALEPPPFPVAQNTLQEVSGHSMTSAVFHALSGQLALKLNLPEKAESEFLQASRLEPANALHQLNWAVLRLASTNPATAQEGGRRLEELTRDRKVGAAAFRSLISASIARRDTITAEQYSSRLLAQFPATFEDRLRHLSLLHENSSGELAGFLSTLQQSTLTNAPAVQALTAWMVSHNLATNAFEWLAGCPETFKNQLPVRLALVGCYEALQDWPGLETFLEAQPWGDSEFARHGLLARAAFHQKHNSQAEAQWRLALHEARAKPAEMKALYNLAGKPLPASRGLELLWRAAEMFRNQDWAFQELQRLSLADKDTRSLNRLYSLMMKDRPRDVIVANNFAATSLLLNINLPQAHDLARRNFLRTAQPVIASTYAYSLHLQERTRDGLEVLRKLPEQALRQPSIALYYGVLLATANQKDSAEGYLKIAERGELLPEEEALLKAAQERH